MANEGNNFKTALKELLGDKENSKTQQKVPSVETVKEEPRFRSVPAPTGQETVVNAQTVIEGSITAKGTVRIGGQVNGDIVSEGDVFITGSVGGNVKGNGISINGGSVVGNLKAAVNVQIENGSAVIGNVEAESLRCNGKCKGDLTVSGEVVLDKDAVIQGNITGGRLSVAMGASISGFVKIHPDEPETATQILPLEE